MVLPDGVVKVREYLQEAGGAERAAVYESRGRPRCLLRPTDPLKREVIPYDVAKAISALSGDFSRTTGTVVPVDSGVAGAFLR